MATESDLLQAVIADPDNDAPRHSYADFLEQNGDVNRAEFIRLQCTLDKLPEDAPQRPDLESREAELLDAYGFDWAQPFGKSISCWMYRRGFIERVQMCLETSADQILATLAKAPIRHVRDITQFCELQGVVDALPYLDCLTGLEFWGLYAFEDSLVDALLSSPHLKNLKTLILHHDRNGNLVDEAVIIKALGSGLRSNIEELAVNVDGSWRGPTTAILKAMADSPSLKNLRKLNLSHAGDPGNSPQMDMDTIRLLGQSPNFAMLEDLDFGRTSFPLELWDEVLKWPWLKNLKWLRLHDARQVKAPDFFYTVAELADLPEYCEAFEDLVEDVDWDTEFISPWDEETCWIGQTWEDRPRRMLFAMNRFVTRQDYAGLEAEYRALCRMFADEQRTAEIDSLPFAEFQESLDNSLKEAVQVLKLKRGKCLYLRFRPDLDNWQIKFGIHDEDTEISEPEDEYSYNSPISEVEGPKFEAAARAYHKQALFQETEPSGTALYLIARTIAAFGRCLSHHDLTVPVYFSCMYVVFPMTKR